MRSLVQWLGPIAGSIAICAVLIYGLAALMKAPPETPVVAAEPDDAQAIDDHNSELLRAAEAEEREALRQREDQWRAGSALPAGVVHSESRVYTVAPNVAGSAADVDAWNALRRNCLQAAADNVRGEFPALQQTACARFEQFAGSKGWATGPLPAVTAAPAPTRAPAGVTVIHQQAESVEPAACAGLLSEKESINERMRHGYTEPTGNYLRERLRLINLELWQLKCKLQ